MVNARIRYIDYLRCFAIWLVVWGHTTQSFGINSAINNYINFHIILTFHMPLFAMMSGLFFRSNLSITEFLKKKVIQLLVPYTFWCIIVYWAIPSFVNPVGLSELWESYIFKGWWFIRGLFLCFIMAYFVEKIAPKYPSCSLVFSVLFFLLLGWTGIIPNMNSPLKDVYFLYPFFVIGIFLKRNMNLFLRNRLQIYIPSVFFFILGSIFWNGWEDTFYQMNTSIFEEKGYEDIVGYKVIERSVLRFIMGVSGSFLCLICFQTFEKKIDSFRYGSLLSNIGKNSICIYLLQYFVFAYIPPRNLFAHQILVVPICIIISLAIVLLSYWISSVTSKSKVLGLILWGKLY